ncbi:MAG: hypothetical protein NT075_09745 [Chloroflexi bacterium]|nr:hypothetical protein [Chloroflexota bacterium]
MPKIFWRLKTSVKAAILCAMWQSGGRRTLYKFLYRLLTGFMVIWLAIFYSALCEYHGLMLPFGPSRMAHMPEMEHVHADNPAASMAMPAHHTSMAMQTDNLVSSDSSKGGMVLQFSHTPLSAVAMSFLTIAVPPSLHLKPVQEQSSLLVADEFVTHQCNLFPPEQPPQFLPFA